MQEDMHYYGTYAMARAAGLQVKHAKVIAYAAQYVDDSKANDSEVHKDGGMFQMIATAHSASEAVGNAMVNHMEQRKVWVPFHFFPGNQGETLSEKLACVKDSKLVQEMVKNHIRHGVLVKNEYGLTLIGITAHVYADTFSHYGFSGISSSKNRIDGKTIQLTVKNPETKAYIMGKFSGALNKYLPQFLIKIYRRILSSIAEISTDALGHGAVGTYPDRPFLKWQFTFEEGKQNFSLRENSKTFLEGCKKLHHFFSEYALQAGISKNPVSFDSIQNKVATILQLELPKEGRIKAWVDLIQQGTLFQIETEEALFYSKEEWEKQKEGFSDLDHAYEIIDTEVYQFHQAAIYHRNYTLKQLLPKHGIVVL